MCGIAGLLRPSSIDSDTAAVRAMLACLMRRGPDDDGLERLPHATFGHRRLSIQDLSAAGHQPMRSGDGRYVVVFNGELYNLDELLAALDVSPGALRSRSDTEVLLLAWERWGLGALERFAGQPQTVSKP